MKFLRFVGACLYAISMWVGLLVLLGAPHTHATLTFDPFIHLFDNIWVLVLASTWWGCTLAGHLCRVLRLKADRESEQDLKMVLWRAKRRLYRRVFEIASSALCGAVGLSFLLAGAFYGWQVKTRLDINVPQPLLGNVAVAIFSCFLLGFGRVAYWIDRQEAAELRRVNTEKATKTDVVFAPGL